MNKLSPMDLETVIGLEVHLQFDTKTKIFCGCVNQFGKDPNTSVCPVCMGLPGSLPVLNKLALEHALKVALALHCNINPYIQFDRKNYFYPDLPKGYQISQFNNPIGRNGNVTIHTAAGNKNIRINRAHLEEDAGKLIHDPDNNCSLVDYNRAGTPLLEIVTEPDLCSPKEAYEYLQTLKLLLRYLNVSDCDMEKGSLRCDANISVRKKGAIALGVKAELKNLNSFKAVKSALTYEEERHKIMFLAGEKILQETRLWDEAKAVTSPMRGKEEAHDYRYFPEPDLVPFIVDKGALEEIRKGLPEFPDAKLMRFKKDYNLLEYDARILIQDPAVADFFEECTRLLSLTKKICNWIIGPLLQEINDRKIPFAQMQLSAQVFTDLIEKVEDGELSNLTGKEILKAVIDSGKTAEQLIKEKGLAQVSDDPALTRIIEEIIKENSSVVEQIKQGKESAYGFLIGQAMKKSKGSANPKKLNELIRRMLHV